MLGDVLVTGYCSAGNPIFIHKVNSIIVEVFESWPFVEKALRLGATRVVVVTDNMRDAAQPD